MGLFNFFSKKNGYTADHTPTLPLLVQKPAEVPEDIFIEKERTKEPTANTSTYTDHNIDVLFQVLDRDHESKGYDDALINPDAYHLEQNIRSLKNELERTIKKVKTSYEDFIKEVEFHIESRSRSGMIDTVEELRMKKEIAENHMVKIAEIEDGARNDRGDSQGIIMSYTKGFKNGLAAISHHTILKRKL